MWQSSDEITKLSNSNSIRISNISVENRLTNDVYRFPGVGDQCECEEGG